MRLAKWMVALTALAMFGAGGILKPLLGVVIGAGWVWLLIRYPRTHHQQTHPVIYQRRPRQRYFRGAFRPYRYIARYATYRAMWSLFR